MRRVFSFTPFFRFQFSGFNFRDHSIFYPLKFRDHSIFFASLFTFALVKSWFFFVVNLFIFNLLQIIFTLNEFFSCFICLFALHLLPCC